MRRNDYYYPLGKTNFNNRPLINPFALLYRPHSATSVAFTPSFLDDSKSVLSILCKARGFRIHITITLWEREVNDPYASTPSQSRP